jgi:DNA-binding winged helix-turn-helix (wHTH) protein
MSTEHEPPQAPVSIDAANAWVWQGGRRLKLAPKAFAVLCHLIEQAGRLVTKEELCTAVWDDTIVSEAVLVSYVRDIRKALGDSSRTPRYVETVHRRGFRFIGPIATSPPPLLSQESRVQHLASEGKALLSHSVQAPGARRGTLIPQAPAPCTRRPLWSVASRNSRACTSC